MIDASFFLGLPVEFKHLCLVYPPKIKEIAADQNYSLYLHFLTRSQEELEDEWIEHKLDLSTILTPFEYILNNAYHSPEIGNIIKKAFYFFIHEPVTFLFKEKQILIGDIKEIKDVNALRILKEEDFFMFQNLLRESIGMTAIELPNPNEDPRVKKMKARARYRDKIKAKRGMGLDFLTVISSICCMGLNLNPLNIGELSYVAATMLMAIYQDKEKYELDIKSILAGGDSKKIHPKYWIKSLQEK